MSMSQLAGLEAISRPSTTGIVSRLIDKGLIMKSDDPEDGRSAIVAITAGGSELLEQRRRERTAFLARRIDLLSDEEQLVLARAAELIERITAEE
jgi:DNA-binding MarR family transcriptional regulator